MDTAGPQPSLPLVGVRVLDLADGGAETTGRLLADLGADVVRVEPPGGAASRRHAPLSGTTSLYALTHGANKRSVTADLGTDAGRGLLWRLVATADLLVTTARPGELEAVGLGPDALLARRPELVVVSVTDFGRTGPYRDWAATEGVHLALGGVLARSGLPGRPPLLPPGFPATESAAAQAAWAGLAAYAERLRTGQGGLVDVSVLEATAQVLDPGFGISGTALGGTPAFRGPRGRPDARHLYPIFRCADGWVRICILSGRQWQGMFRWLGEPAEFADPELAAIGRRFAAVDRIYPAIGRLFAPLRREEVLAAARAHGVPAAPLLGPAEVLVGEQFQARGAFTELPVGQRRATVPDGFVEIDGIRAGIRLPAAAAGQHTAQVLAELDRPAAPTERVEGAEPAEPVAAAGARAGEWPDGEAIPAVRGRPFTGLRVLDLGVIVVGAELGRLFADLGAEVIKIENRAFPDGSRQSLDGSAMSPGFAYGHRNKLGLGLDLRSPEGARLFRRLVAHSDVVLSNFRPGTLEALGLGPRELARVNPRIIVADSSAFGSTGPWADRMGYGPLVRAAAGLTALWRYPDDPDGYSDASTIYPDHVVARLSATAVLAMLLARRRTGRGGRVSVAQAEVMLGQLAPLLALESLAPGALAPEVDLPGADAPHGVYPCAGDDEWCVVTIRGDAEWDRLVGLLGDAALAGSDDPRFADAAARRARRAGIDAALSAWTRGRTPRQAAAELQAVGVPAGMMQRVVNLIDDPHLVERGFLRTLRHPCLAEPLPTEGGPAVSTLLADPPSRPAPLPGQHSRDVLRGILGLTDGEIDRLVADGVVEIARPPAQRLPAGAATATATADQTRTAAAAPLSAPSP
ncbi:putative CoA-transferase Rv1866 [Frankia sp. AiPs1]|uniref:CaiB/BaiF CoA transferase family protein n=1 Tax=Frankia sp. AiPa1 TaxID=573492 RepID=UPI00202B8669|nr:CoA transferase [Frankia sp. AiPa1]MCL9762475.1 CoA transferase [Frankia sp. AiPa1]